MADETATTSTVVSITVDYERIMGALVSAEGGLSAFHSLPIPHQAEQGVLLQTVLLVCKHVIGYADPKALLGVGVSVAAPVNRHDGVLMYSGVLPQLDGVALHTYMQSALNLPVTVTNDVNARALLEAYQGAGQDAETSFYIFVDHEINGAIVQDGRIWYGMHSNAGEIGYLVAGWMGTKPITLGQRASGKGIAAEYNMRSRQHRTPSLDEIMQYAKQGDHLAIRVVRDGARILGSVLRPVMNLLDPSMVIVGGRFAYGGDLWWQNFEAAFDEAGVPTLGKTILIRSQFTEEAALLGAALQLRQQQTSNL